MGAADTMLLTVDVEKLPGDTLKWEPVAHRDDGDLLPHLFAALPLESVTTAALLELNEAGEPQLPPPAEAAPAVDAGIGEGRPASRWRLDGMRVVVTGSTKGIGKAVASELLGLGASVLIHSRSAADVQALVDEWRGAQVFSDTDCFAVALQAEYHTMMNTNISSTFFLCGGFRELLSRVTTDTQSAVACGL